MSTGNTTEILLGCDPQVRVEIIEDNGNLFMRVVAPDPDAVDIDALFFNLADDVDASALTIYPDYDEAIGSNGENVTGFTVATGTLNQMDNGAQVQEPYDVRLEFGTTPYSSQGDVNEATLTFYIDGGGSNLTADSIDLSNLTAVVNTDNGGGMALTGGIGNTGDDQAAVYETNVVASDDFNGISYASQSDIVSYGGYWQATNGELEANGCHDGNIWFEPVDVNGDAEISFDARAPHTEYFENGGCYGDSLEVWALVDGNEWVLMDTFVVNDEGTALVGDTTGQTITADSQTLTYSGGALDGASSVQLVLDADISASNEEIFIDNVEVSETVLVESNDSAPENLLVNGGLESGVDANTWQYNGNPDGWTNDNGGIETWGNSFLGYEATEGDSFIELDRARGDQVDNLYQDVQTEEGQDYTVSFDAAQRGLDSDHIEVYWNGELIRTVSPDDTDWESFQVTVTGTGGMDRLEFRELASENDSTGPLMDNIQMVEDNCILENGDLESNTADNTWQLNGNPVGWTNDNGGIETWGDGFLGYDAASGQSYVELDRTNADQVDNLYQDVQTVEGQVYTLEFDAAQRGLDSDSIEVYWNGDLIQTVSPEDQDWETFSIQVTGTGGEDRLEFRELASENDCTGPLMDNICLVPEDGDLESNCGQYDVTYDELMVEADPAAAADDQSTDDDQVDDLADALI